MPTSNREGSRAINSHAATMARAAVRISFTAAELESLLLNEIGTMLAKPEMLAGVMHSAAELDENGKRLKLNQVRTAFADLVKVWDVMFPVEQYKFIRSIIAGITVYPDKVKIEYDTAGLEQIIAETEGVK